MTLDEANTVAAIVSYAHGGCGECVEGLLSMLAKAFPEFRWLLHDHAVSPDTDSTDPIGPSSFVRAESNLQ